MGFCFVVLLCVGQPCAFLTPRISLSISSWCLDFQEVNRQILREEEEKAKIQKELSRLTERLSKINESLQRKMQARAEFDQTIQETEAAYMKILESSQTLLNVLKRESASLVKKKQTSS